MSGITVLPFSILIPPAYMVILYAILFGEVIILRLKNVIFKVK